MARTKKVTTIEKINHELLGLYVRVFNSNQRQGTSKTKTKAEVSGGGAKPFKQKGTGRARQGSRRSPQWVHGGISHGPVPKDWSLGLTKNMKRGALKSALLLKDQTQSVITIDDLVLKLGKTSELLKILKPANISGKTLVITPKSDRLVIRAGRNVSGLKIESANAVSVYDILDAKSIVFAGDARKKLEARI